MPQSEQHEEINELKKEEIKALKKEVEFYKQDKTDSLEKIRKLMGEISTEIARLHADAFNRGVVTQKIQHLTQQQQPMGFQANSYLISNSKRP